MPMVPAFTVMISSAKYKMIVTLLDLLYPLPYCPDHQFLNYVHSTSGLPWWASIPLATVTLRAALLPFSLRAKVIMMSVFSTEHFFTNRFFVDRSIRFSPIHNVFFTSCVPWI